MENARPEVRRATHHLAAADAVYRAQLLQHEAAYLSGSPKVLAEARAAVLAAAEAMLDTRERLLRAVYGAPPP